MLFPDDDVCSCIATGVMAWLGQELALKHKGMTATQELEELRHQQRCYLDIYKSVLSVRSV